MPEVFTIRRFFSLLALLVYHHQSYKLSGFYNLTALQMAVMLMEYRQAGSHS